MNILVIDDLPDVVNGILKGVNWNNIHIQETYYAYDIFHAKELLLAHPIEIMLCDIEMPMGSGLELFEWTVQKFPALKCIFLTSHAEFAFAQKAIQLGCFDFILQPAQYKEIEKVIQRAVAVIEKEHIEEKYIQYGFYISKQQQELRCGFLEKHIKNLQSNVAKTLSHLNALSLEFHMDTKCLCILVHALRWENNNEILEDDLFSFAIENIFTEFMDNSKEKCLVFPLGDYHYILLVYDIIHTDVCSFSTILEQVSETLNKYFGCFMAFYLHRFCDFQHLSIVYSQLGKQKRNNVTGQSGVFFCAEKKQPISYTEPNLKRWHDLLNEGKFLEVKGEVHDYFYRCAGLGNINIDVLFKFQQDFLQIFFDTIHEHELKAHEVFVAQCDYEAVMKAPTSLEKMLELVDFLISYMEVTINKNSQVTSQIDKLEDYIRKNIHKNITRTELAELVYLNPEYLSRLFRKEKKMSITEYITKEKMDFAKVLLQKTNFPVAIIASKVGYSNFSHFAQAFKKIYGVSPSDYRKLLQDSLSNKEQ